MVKPNLYWKEKTVIKVKDIKIEWIYKKSETGCALSPDLSLWSETYGSLIDMEIGM